RHRSPLRQRSRTAGPGSRPARPRDRPRLGNRGSRLPQAARGILAIFLTMHSLSGIDVFIVVLYIVGTTLLGIWCTRGQRVIWTDVIQFTIYILGALFAGYSILNYLPGGWSEFWAVGEQAGKFKLFDFSTEPTVPYTLWAGLLGGAFLSMASHGADQMMVQR